MKEEKNIKAHNVLWKMSGDGRSRILCRSIHLLCIAYFLNFTIFFRISSSFSIKMIKSRKLIIRILRALWIIVLIHNEFFIFWKYANNLSTQLDVRHIDEMILECANDQR